MAFGLHNPILAGDFNDLKARVKSECLRRKYNGSVAQYGDAAYDYTSIPTTGQPPLPEHLNKIIVPLNAIRNTGITETQSGFLVRDISYCEQLIGELESIEQDAANSGCSASCTGLCQGTCTDACTNGCKGGCKSGCKGGCKSGCGTSCNIACADGCTDDCTGNCGADCGIACSGLCIQECANNCTGGCMNKCQGSCTGGAKSITPD